VWIFLELVFVCTFYIETRGPTLEEVAKLFDGDEVEERPGDDDPFSEFKVMTDGFEKEQMRTVRYEHIKLDKPIKLDKLR
jgi:hypothetical protein